MLHATAPAPAGMAAHLASLQRELRAMEAALTTVHWQSALHGRRLLYVGGQPRSNAAIDLLVMHAGGHVVHYTGLVDEGGPFEAWLQGIHQVCVPLDLVDAESVAASRRICSRQHVAWRALRSASVASFIAGLQRDPAVGHAVPAPRAVSCLHHG